MKRTAKGGSPARKIPRVLQEYHGWGGICRAMEVVFVGYSHAGVRVKPYQLPA